MEEIALNVFTVNVQNGIEKSVLGVLVKKTIFMHDVQRLLVTAEVHLQDDWTTGLMCLH